MPHLLKYIHHNTIDKEGWNTLVDTSANASVFCYSWYLDALCEWDALILNDYEGAIALPKRILYRLFALGYLGVANCNRRKYQHAHTAV